MPLPAVKKPTGQQEKWVFPSNISFPEDKVRLVGRMTICLAVSMGQSRCQSCNTWLQTFMLLYQKFVFIIKIYELPLNSSLTEEDKYDGDKNYSVSKKKLSICFPSHLLFLFPVSEQ